MPKRSEKQEAQKKHWWETVPGVLTGLAAIITAVAGLLAALYATRPDKGTSDLPLVSVTQATTGPAQSGGPTHSTATSTTVNARRLPQQPKPAIGTTSVDSTGSLVTEPPPENPPIQTDTVPAKPAVPPALPQLRISNARILFTSVRSQKDASTRLDVELLSSTDDVIGAATVTGVHFPSRRTMPVDLKLTPSAESETARKGPYKIKVKVTTGKDEWVFSAKAVLEWFGKDPSTHVFPEKIRVNERNPVVTLSERL